MAQLKYRFQIYSNSSWPSIILSDCQAGACRHFWVCFLFLINDQTYQRQEREDNDNVSVDLKS